jgi:tetratricopeptide (TPR) repeat protein
VIHVVLASDSNFARCDAVSEGFNPWLSVRRKFTTSAIFILALTLSACRGPTQRKLQTDASPSASAPAATPRSGVTAAPVASVAPLKGATKITPPPSKAIACPAFSRALAQARQASRGGKLTDAISAYDKAVRARPFDALPRAERGVVYLEMGKTERAIVDFDFARALTNDANLLAQVHYNLAVAAQLQGKPNDVRLALALAARQGSALARDALGTASTCPAMATAKLGTVGPIARNFRELAKFRTLACTDRSPEVGTEEQARKHVCRGCSYGDKDEGDQCTGPGPWKIDSGYMDFTHFTFFVVPLPENGFFYYNDNGLKYRIEQGHLIIEDSHDIDVILALKEASPFIRGNFPDPEDPYINDSGEWTDQLDVDGNLKPAAIRVCQQPKAEVDLGDFRGIPTLPSVRPNVIKAYSLHTGRERFSLAVFAGKVSATLDAKQAHIRGEGCDMDLELPEDLP